MEAVSRNAWLTSKELDGSLSICPTVQPSRGPEMNVMANSVPGQPPYFLVDGKPVNRSSSLRDLQIAGAIAERLALSA